MRLSFFVFLSCFLLSCKVSLIHAAPLGDLVEQLPDFGRPPTAHFSGYLDATAGCDTSVNGAYCKLHYWLAMAEGEDSVNRPVVLWLNGGPGSSSLIGFLQENGPLLINATGGLMENPWSWTKVANFMALEAPVGVGYSYCEAQVKGKVCQNTDKFTASASRAALQDFFRNKFPELAHNDFFITGESYAGVYIPTLAKEVLDHAPEIRLKGVAVGDPCTDNTAQRDSMDALWYGHKYGLVDDAIFEQLWNKCQIRMPTAQLKSHIHRSSAADATVTVAEAHSSHGRKSDFTRHWHRMLRSAKTVSKNRHEYDDTDECRLALRKFAMSSSRALSQGWKDMYIDDYSLFAPMTHQQDDDMETYMSRPDVRIALHVTETPIKHWPDDPELGFDYTKEYDACNDNAVPGSRSMIDFYKNIVTRLQRTWIYNGDTDPCVTYEGTRTAVKRIGLEELDGGSYRPWFYNQTAVDPKIFQERAPLFAPNVLAQEMGAQMGGEVTNYEAGLSFLTIHGSGHMVPQFR